MTTSQSLLQKWDTSRIRMKGVNLGPFIYKDMSNSRSRLQSLKQRSSSQKPTWKCKGQGTTKRPLTIVTKKRGSLAKKTLPSHMKKAHPSSQRKQTAQEYIMISEEAYRSSKLLTPILLNSPTLISVQNMPHQEKKLLKCCIYMGLQEQEKPTPPFTYVKSWNCHSTRRCLQPSGLMDTKGKKYLFWKNSNHASPVQHSCPCVTHILHQGRAYKKRANLYNNI